MNENNNEVKTTGVFDENGHRVRRNKATQHRMPPKVGQVNPESFKLTFMFPLELVAKARRFLAGKEVPSTPRGGRKVRKPTRAMTPGDLFREYLQVLTRDVVLTAEDIAWVESMRKTQAEKRQRQDAMIAAGVNRIPKEQQLKRGMGAKYNPPMV